MKKVSIFAALAAAAFCFAPASAQACGYEYCWGAVAYNPNTGAYGWAANNFSENGAASAAQQGCSYNCTEIHTFANMCGAVALGATGGSGWAGGQTRYEAESVALAYCNNYDYGCQVLVWACSY